MVNVQCLKLNDQSLFCVFLNVYRIIFAQISTLFFLKLANNILCPEELKNLFDQCCVTAIKKRPSLSHIAKTLLVSSLSKKKKKRKKMSDNKVLLGEQVWHSGY